MRRDRSGGAHAARLLDSAREVGHIVLHSDELKHNTAEIAFPQTVELQYVEVSSTDGGKSLKPGSFQVYGRMGECESAHTFVELTDGPRWLEDGPVLLDAKALQTERLTIRGDFEGVTVRAIGAVIGDASATSAAASAPLQLSEVPQYLSSNVQEQPVPSQSLLPLRGLPQSFVQALDPIAQYWQAAGMSLGTHWPECMIHYHDDETFSPLISLAEDLMNVLTEATSACPLSLPMLQRLKAHMRREAGDSTCQPIPSQVGELEMNTFIRVVVAWMGLSAATRAGEKRADEFSLFALAAALVLCSTPATATMFMRYGGVARCSQILSEHQNVPHSPYIRYTTAILAMLAECCTEAVTEIATREDSQLRPSANAHGQSPTHDQQGAPEAPTAADATAEGDPDDIPSDLEPPTWEAPQPEFVVPGFGRINPHHLIPAPPPKPPKGGERAGRSGGDARGAGKAKGGEKHVEAPPDKIRDRESAERPLDDHRGVDGGSGGGMGRAQDSGKGQGSADRAIDRPASRSASEGQGGRRGGTPQQRGRSGAPSDTDARENSMQSYSSDATSSLLGHTPSPEHSTGHMDHSRERSPDRSMERSMERSPERDSQGRMRESSAQPAEMSREQSREIEGLSAGHSGEGGLQQGGQDGSDGGRSPWDADRKRSRSISQADVARASSEVGRDRDRSDPDAVEAAYADDVPEEDLEGFGHDADAAVVLEATAEENVAAAGNIDDDHEVGPLDLDHSESDLELETGASDGAFAVGEEASGGDLGEADAAALPGAADLDNEGEVRGEGEGFLLEGEEEGGKRGDGPEDVDACMDTEGSLERQRGAGGGCSSEDTVGGCEGGSVDGEQRMGQAQHTPRRSRGAGDSTGNAPDASAATSDVEEQHEGDDGDLLVEPAGDAPVDTPIDDTAVDNTAVDDAQLVRDASDAAAEDAGGSVEDAAVNGGVKVTVNDDGTCPMHEADGRGCSEEEHGVNGAAVELSSVDGKEAQESGMLDGERGASGDEGGGKGSRKRGREDGYGGQHSEEEVLRVKVSRGEHEETVGSGERKMQKELVEGGAGVRNVNADMHAEDELAANGGVNSHDKDGDHEMHAADLDAADVVGGDDAMQEDSMHGAHACDSEGENEDEKTDAAVHAKDSDGQRRSESREAPDATAAPAGEGSGALEKKQDARKRTFIGRTTAATAAARRIAAGEKPPSVPEQRPLLIGPAVAEHLKPLPQLLCAALRAPHARDTLALGNRFLQHLALQEAMHVFESCTEALIGKVQQGAIGFSDADEGILRVARALGDVCGCLEVLCAPPARTWWREAPYALLKKLPEVPAGDAAALRCVARRGILLRCMQMILLPPMIVNAIVEAGSALATKERQSLERRLGTHFHVPLRGFFTVLLQTTEGFMLLCHDPDTCRQLSAALSSTPAPPLGELPLLPRTPPTANAPESALATQLAFLATAKNAWDTAVGAVLGSPAAMQAMHALLHLTEDEEMCQMLGRVLLVTPAAQEWLQHAILDSVAMELICGAPMSDSAARVSMEWPKQLKDRIDELSTPHGESQTPREAPFAPSVLHALCSRSLTLFASSWASFLCPEESSALSLRCKSQQDELNTDETNAPPHSLVIPQCRSQQVQWLWECVCNMRAHREHGITSLLTTLDANLPPLTEDCLEALPRSQVAWASTTPLCPGDSPAFVLLRHSARARGKTTSALMLVNAALSDVPDGIVTPALTVMHAHAGVVKGGGLGVLTRAVGTAVTWIHSLRAANVRTLSLGESHILSDSAGDLAEAMMLLQHACGALCVAVGALLKVPSGRAGVRGGAPMHARWRVVCHMLLAAYHVIHWMPDNLRTLLRPPSVVTPPLATRHTIVATLQLWLTVQHPICPLREALWSGALRNDDLGEEAGETGCVKAWASPAALTSLLCVLGDICATAWPLSRGHSDRKLSEMLPYGELRAAVAAASGPLAREIQALVHSCCVSHCRLIQAGFARCVTRLLSCSASVGTWLLTPIIWDLKALISQTHLQVHRVHALLRTTVPMLSCPLVKAHMREQNFEQVLCDVLHRSVGAWTDTSISEEHCVALQAVCQVVVDALQIMCDIKVSMAAGEPIADRTRSDLPASKHLILLVCTLLECLPFLEGSSDSAVEILSDLIMGPPAPHIVPAVRKGAQTASEAYTVEERAALGNSTLAIATTGTSPLIYLADQLTKRADTLRGAGKFVSTVPACTTAAELMRHLDTAPDSGDATTTDAAPQAITAQRYAAAAAAAAAAAGVDSPEGTTAGDNNGSSAATTTSTAPSNATAAKSSVVGSFVVPLDAIGPLALAHETEMSRFVDYAQLREMPAAAGDALEEITTVSTRGSMLAPLMPSTLDPPAWAPARPQPVDAQPAASRKRAAVPLKTQHDAKPTSHGPPYGGMLDMHADVSGAGEVKPPMVTGSSGAMHGLHASDEFMGGGAAEAKPKAENGDLYSDLMSGSLHASHASGRAGTATRATKPARATSASAAARSNTNPPATGLRSARPPPAVSTRTTTSNTTPVATPAEPRIATGTASVKTPPTSSQGVAKTPGSNDGSAPPRRARAMAMAGVLPASVRPLNTPPAAPKASGFISAAHSPGIQPVRPPLVSGAPPKPPTSSYSEAAARASGVDSNNGADAATTAMNTSNNQSSIMSGAKASTQGTLPPGPTHEDVYSRSVPVPARNAPGFVNKTPAASQPPLGASISIGASSKLDATSTQLPPPRPASIPPPPTAIAGPSTVANTLSPGTLPLPPPPPRGALMHAAPPVSTLPQPLTMGRNPIAAPGAVAPKLAGSATPGSSLPGPQKGSEGGGPAMPTGMPPPPVGVPQNSQGIQDLLKDPTKLRELLSDPRWAAFFAAQLKSKLKPGS